MRNEKTNHTSAWHTLGQWRSDFDQKNGDQVATCTRIAAIHAEKKLKKLNLAFSSPCGHRLRFCGPQTRTLIRKSGCLLEPIWNVWKSGGLPRLLRQFQSVGMFFVTLMLFGKNLFQPLCLPFRNPLVHRRRIVPYEELLATTVTPQRAHLL